MFSMLTILRFYQKKK